MRIQCLQHVYYEGPACILEWAARRGHEFAVFRPPQGDDFPNPGDFDLLIVLGGPFGADEEKKLPWLAAEKKFVRRVIEGGGLMLGICLGAQLAAKALGATVYPLAHKEIGWYPVSRAAGATDSRFGEIMPDSIEAFHWHGDTFDIPSGAIHLASSDACHHQGFAHDEQVVGLQFHLEPSADWVAGLIKRDADQLVDGPYIQAASDITRDDTRYGSVNRVMEQILDQFEALAT